MITYRKADTNDPEMLVEARCSFLRALRSPGGDAGKGVDPETEREIESRREAIRSYHERAFIEDRIVAFMAYDETIDDLKKLIGFGEGKHVYEAYGFMPMSENDMILKI